jgi:hypothetical protein
VDPRWLWDEAKEAPRRPGEDLLLSHDPPLPPWDWEGRGYSNTLADLLDFVTDPQGPFVAVARANPAPPLRIALCFKGAPPGGVCDGTRRARQWLRAVDRFFVAAQERLAGAGLEQPGQVEFVLDGNALPVGCLAQRWRPWASVWMNGSAPAAAFASDLPAREGLDRFRVLNEAAKAERWAYIAQPQVAYGKFSRPSSPYPYQAWEPAAQATIQELVRVFANGPPHAPGLDFATNADVAMLQVYAGVGLNQELPQPPSASASASQHHGAKGSGDGLEGLVAVLRPGLALVLEQRLSSSSGHLRAYAFDADAPLSSLRGKELVQLPPTEGLPLPGWTRGAHGGIQTMVAASPRVLWVSTEEGHYFVYAIHEETRGGAVGRLQLELQQMGSLAGPAMVASARERRLRRDGQGGRKRRRRGEPRQSLSTAVLSHDEHGALRVLELLVPAEGDGCGLAYQIVAVPLLGEDAGASSSLRPPLCLWSSSPGRSSSSSSSSRSSGEVESAAAVAIAEAGGDAMLVFAAAGGEVFALLLLDDSAPSSSCWVQVGVGEHVTPATSARGGNESVVMLVAGGGFCYNSHLHNTGPVDVCKLRPKHTPGVLDYTYGWARDWVALLRDACGEGREPAPAPAPVRRRPLSACDARLLHGSYDLGTRPSLALYALPGGEVGMLAVHAGFEVSCPAEDVPPVPPPLSLGAAPGDDDDDDYNDEGPPYHWRRACACGPALPRPGRLVADSFPLRL